MMKLFSFLIFSSFFLRRVSLVIGDVGTAASYGPPYIPTACGGNRAGQFPPGNLFAAVNEGLWDNGAACGRRYRISNQNQTKANATNLRLTMAMITHFEIIRPVTLSSSVSTTEINSLIRHVVFSKNGQVTRLQDRAVYLSSKSMEIGDGSTEEYLHSSIESLEELMENSDYFMEISNRPSVNELERRERRRYFDRMVRMYGIKTSVEHYGCKVDLLGRSGFIQEAYDIIKGLPMERNGVISRSFLAACRHHGSRAKMKNKSARLLEKLVKPPFLLIGLGGLLLRLFGLQRLQLGVVVIRHAKERQPVTEQINRRHGVLDNRPREGNQEPVLHHASDVHCQCRGLPDEEKNCEVEREGTEGVGPEDHEIELKGGGVSEDRVLDEDPGDGEEDEAAGGDVVERGDGVE
ncbi:Pentatricopeptide repeat-containing protein [Vigna angularis]|uniref:Pentatricopeptide repeat-containing protein n=1 Tax=Phaseolus angularis TaxID=3914 RepID=A0A8T0KLC9_PHAAN|nr:Pentatricopeptide repeat-containing protein [Vigna angularis]